MNKTFIGTSLYFRSVVSVKIKFINEVSNFFDEMKYQFLNYKLDVPNENFQSLYIKIQTFHHYLD